MMSRIAVALELLLIFSLLGTLIYSFVTFDFFPTMIYVAVLFATIVLYTIGALLVLGTIAIWQQIRFVFTGE